MDQRPAFTGKPHGMKTMIIQGVERASNVHDPALVHRFDRPDGGFRDNTSNWRRIAGLKHQRRDAEGGGRTVDRTEIVRIADLIEHRDPGCATGDHLLDLNRGQGIELRRETLMDRIARQHRVNRAATKPFGYLCRNVT